MGIVTLTMRSVGTFQVLARGLTKECSTQAAQHHIDTDSKRDKKDGSIDVHAGQRCDNCTSAQKKLTTNQDVC